MMVIWYTVIEKIYGEIFHLQSCKNLERLGFCNKLTI